MVSPNVSYAMLGLCHWSPQGVEHFQVAAVVRSAYVA